MRKAIMAIGLLAVVAGGGYWYQTRSVSPDAGKAAGGPGGGMAVAVEAAKVQVGPISREIQAVGSLRSNESVMVRPEVAGRIDRFQFNEGDRVTKGQMLVRLDDSNWAAAVEEARANVALAQSNFQRAQELARKGAGTERTRDEAEAKLRVDQARLESARAALQKTQIVAPFDGVVGLRQVSVGAYVQPGQDIVNLESLDPIKVDFRIPEVHLAALRSGQTLDVVVDAYPGQAFSGQVYAIDPAVDLNGRAVLVRARLPNADGLLRPGLFARVALVVERQDNAIQVPEQAIVPRGAEVMVFRVVDGKAVPTPVKTGKRRAGMVEVTEGLGPDDTVITAGQMKVRPGAAVNVVNAKQGA